MEFNPDSPVPYTLTPKANAALSALANPHDTGIRAAQARAWANKVRHGFNTTNVPLEFCLLTGELAEAFDAWRKGRSDDLGPELADVAIFLLGLAEMTGTDLADELTHKFAVIEARIYKPLPNGVLAKTGTRNERRHP